MILHLFKKKNDFILNPEIPPGVRIYAVGDIHGRDDLLQTMHKKILKDARAFQDIEKKIIVYLGDYIDRGLESKEVLDRLINSPLDGFQSVFLKGNHEDIFLKFLQNSTVGPAWFKIGGDAFVYSYRISVDGHPSATEKYRTIQEKLNSCLPASHLIFLSQLQNSFEMGDYFFVHAGILPGVPLNEQRTKHLFWIRDDFTAVKTSHEKIIVHGHVIRDKPEICKNRIGIDTGAFCSNILTCLVLEGETRRFLQT
ncbi:MAG: metallophosphoesterase [Nitrospinota bacterium]